MVSFFLRFLTSYNLVSYREVEAWGQTLASLTTLLEYLQSTLLPMCKDGHLLPDIDITPSELLGVLNTISQYSFYGRCLGFHVSFIA